MEALMQREIIQKRKDQTCNAYTTVVETLRKGDLTEAVYACKETLGCPAKGDGFCEVFANESDEEYSDAENDHRRKLLVAASDLPGQMFFPKSPKRSLLGMSVAAEDESQWKDMTLNEFLDRLYSCELCKMCAEGSEWMYYAKELPSTVDIEEIRTGCVESIGTSREKLGECSSVCNSEESCWSHPAECACETSPVCEGNCSSTFPMHSTRCVGSSRRECSENSFCLWKSDEDDSRDAFTMFWDKHALEHVCEKIEMHVDKTVEVAESSEPLHFNDICESVCENANEMECMEFIDSIFEDSPPDDPRLFRKQLLVEGKPEGTVQEFMMQIGSCEVCELCREDPGRFESLAYRHVKNDQPSSFVEKCYDELKDKGSCRSRCDVLDARECWKEEENFCTCDSEGVGKNETVPMSMTTFLIRPWQDDSTCESAPTMKTCDEVSQRHGKNCEWLEKDPEDGMSISNSTMAFANVVCPVIEGAARVNQTEKMGELPALDDAIAFCDELCKRVDVLLETNNNMTVVGICDECRRQPYDFVDTVVVIGMTSETDTFDQECSAHLASVNDLRGSCKALPMSIGGECDKDCNQHYHLDDCQGAHTFDECNSHSHCRWPEETSLSAALDKKAQASIAAGFCDRFSSLVNHARRDLKEMQTSSLSQTCMASWECDTEYHKKVCELMAPVDPSTYRRSLLWRESLFKDGSSKNELLDFIPKITRRRILGFLSEQEEEEMKFLGDSQVSDLIDHMMSCSICPGCYEDQENPSDFLGLARYAAWNMSEAAGDSFCVDHIMGGEDDSKCRSVCNLYPDSCTKFPQFCSCRDDHDGYYPYHSDLPEGSCCLAPTSMKDYDGDEPWSCWEIENRQSCDNAGCKWDGYHRPGDETIIRLVKMAGEGGMEDSAAKLRICETLEEFRHRPVTPTHYESSKGKFRYRPGNPSHYETFAEGPESEFREIHELEDLEENLFMDGSGFAEAPCSDDLCNECMGDKTVREILEMMKKGRFDLPQLEKDLGWFLGQHPHEGECTPYPGDQHHNTDCGYHDSQRGCEEAGCQVGPCPKGPYHNPEAEQCEGMCMVSRHYDDTCGNASRDECLENPEEVCSRAEKYTEENMEGGLKELEQRLGPEEVCGFICPGNDADDCEKFKQSIGSAISKKTAMSGSGAGGYANPPDSSEGPDDEGHFRRRLQDEGYPEPTIKEFMKKLSLCSICRDCRKNPEDFSSVVLPVAENGPAAVGEACRKEFEKGDDESEGECESRCSHIDPRECWKESGFCSCSDHDESPPVCEDIDEEKKCYDEDCHWHHPTHMDGVSDVACRIVRGEMAGQLDEILSDETQPASCKAFCPEDMDQCSEMDGKMEDMEPPMECKICFVCENDPMEFIQALRDEHDKVKGDSGAMAEGCGGSCRSYEQHMKEEPDMEECSYCSGPHEMYTPSCHDIHGFDACLAEEHCRWEAEDEFEAFLKTTISPYLELKQCERTMDFMKRSRMAASDEFSIADVKELCLESFQCKDTALAEICPDPRMGEGDEQPDDRFNESLDGKQPDGGSDGKPDEDMNVGRKMLWSLDTVKDIISGKALVGEPAKRRRALLEAAENAGMMGMTITDYFDTMMKCQQCSQCEYPSFLEGVQEESQGMDDTMFDLHYQECGKKEFGGWFEGRDLGRCHSACDTHTENCHKFDFCQCGHRMDDPMDFCYSMESRETCPAPECEWKEFDFSDTMGVMNERSESGGIMVENSEREDVMGGKPENENGMMDENSEGDDMLDGKSESENRMMGENSERYGMCVPSGYGSPQPSCCVSRCNYDGNSDRNEMMDGMENMNEKETMDGMESMGGKDMTDGMGNPDGMENMNQKEMMNGMESCGVSAQQCSSYNDKPDMCMSSGCSWECSDDDFSDDYRSDEDEMCPHARGASYCREMGCEWTKSPESEEVTRSYREFCRGIEEKLPLDDSSSACETICLQDKFPECFEPGKRRLLGKHLLGMTRVQEDEPDFPSKDSMEEGNAGSDSQKDDFKVTTSAEGDDMIRRTNQEGEPGESMGRGDMEEEFVPSIQCQQCECHMSSEGPSLADTLRSFKPGGSKTFEEVCMASLSESRMEWMGTCETPEDEGRKDFGGEDHCCHEKEDDMCQMYSQKEEECKKMGCTYRDTEQLSLDLAEEYQADIDLILEKFTELAGGDNFEFTLEAVCEWFDMPREGCMEKMHISMVVEILDTMAQDPTDLGEVSALLEKKVQELAKEAAAREACSQMPKQCEVHDNVGDCEDGGCEWSTCMRKDERIEISQEELEQTCNQGFRLLSEVAEADTLEGLSEFCQVVDPESDIPDCAERASVLVGLIAAGYSRQEFVERCTETEGALEESEVQLENFKHLLCDPEEACCRKFSLTGDGKEFQFGMLPGAAACMNDEACDFEPECILEEDLCLKQFTESDSNDCGSDCVTVEVDGEKVGCVDKKRRDMCNRDLRSGCDEEGCVWKPGCTPREVTSFDCEEGDACCIATMQTKFTDAQTKQCTEQDPSDGASCKVQKVCTQLDDACRMISEPWECEDQPGCHFKQEPTDLDQFAGKCMTTNDRCEGASMTECAKIRVGGSCAVVDRCEVNTCDGTDQCCELDQSQCQADETCLSEAQCQMRPGFDTCLKIKTEADCQNSSDCAWDGSTCKVQDDFDMCRERYHSRALCESLGGCKYTEACLSHCSLCEECIDEMSKLQSQDLTTRAAMQIVYDKCKTMTAQYPDLQQNIRNACNVYKIARNPAVLKRPAALCQMIEACTSDCTNKDDDELDLCSDTGYASGLLAEQVDSTAEGLCLKSKNCGPTETCDFSILKKECSCDSSTGFDRCSSVGQCANKCKEFESHYAKFNSQIASCSVDSDCETEGDTCDTTLSKRCTKMSCNESSGQPFIENCDGLCTAGGLTMTSAQFDNWGKSITIQLNHPAKSVLRFRCSKVFDTDSSTKLGSGCFGSVMHTQIFLSLRNPTIEVDDTIAFADDQTVIKDGYKGTTRFSSRDADDNLVPTPVAGCGEDCVAPVTVVVHPPVLSAGCGNGQVTPSADLDGSYTLDFSGRPLTCLWSVDSASCLDGTSSCPILQTKLEDSDISSDHILTLSGTEIDSIAETPGIYTVTLNCTNFLGASSSAEATIEFLGTPVPSVSVVGPLERTFYPSKGLRIAAYINPGSVCPGDTVVYSWTQQVEDGEESWIPDGEVVRKDLRLKGPLSAEPYQTYTVLLTAQLQKTDMSFRSGNSTVQVNVTALPSDMSGKLTGAGGDVIMTEDLVLTAVCEDPDDPLNALEPFTYAFECVKTTTLDTGDDFEQPCTESGTITENQIVLGKDSLTFDIWYAYTVICTKSNSKPDGSVAVRTAMGSTEFKPRSAESLIPTATITQQCGSKACPAKNDPKRRLKFLLDLKYRDTEIVWSCTGVELTDNDVVRGLTRRALVIKGGVFDESQTVTCTAALTRVDDSGTEHVGEAKIDVEINAIPYCTTTKCVTASLKDGVNTFPDAKYTVAVSNFVDDEPDLEFSFGCMEAGSQKVFQRGSQAFFTLEALDVGAHLCFACAIDRSGTVVCEYYNVDVLEPVGEISAEQQTAAVDEVKEAEASGDPVLVVMSIKKANNILTYSSSAQRRRSLKSDQSRQLLQSETTLENTFSMVQSLVKQIQESDPLDFTLYQSSLDELARMTENYHYQSAELAMYGIRVGLDASSDEFTVLDVQNILAVATTYDTLFTSTAAEDIVEAYSNITTLVQDTAGLLCLDSSPGDESITASSSSAGKEATISCVREVPFNVDGKILALADASLEFPSDFSDNCGDTCTEDFQLDLYGSYLNSSSIHSALIGTPILDVGVSDVRWLSGIVNVQSTALNRDEICESEGCYMLVTLPVEEFTPSKQTVCLRIEDGEAVGRSDIGGVWFVADSYDESAGTVKCNITRFGEIFVADYTEPPSPPPPFPPPSPPPPSPPPPADLDEQPAEMPSSQSAEAPAPETDNELAPPPVDEPEVKKVVAELKFNTLSFADVSGNSPEAVQKREKLTADTITQVKKSNKNIREVKVTGIKPGSVVVTLEISFAADSNEETKKYLEDLTNMPEDLFDESFTDEYGPVTASLVEVPDDLKKKEKSGPSPIIFVAVGAAVVLVAGILIGGLLCRRRSRNAEHQQTVSLPI
ncbi:hypothetical protein BSKO_11305 [Bryopsis sp. KO-2023]|nr:hypothetical protein BSKO_11305 [Bryopsis sp. KO-2023]